MARIGPLGLNSSSSLPDPADESERSRSQPSNASGSGSSHTVSSNNRRLITIPIESGLVFRLRWRRRPSEASSAASSGRQMSAGRKGVLGVGVSIRLVAPRRSHRGGAVRRDMHVDKESGPFGPAMKETS